VNYAAAASRFEEACHLLVVVRGDAVARVGDTKDVVEEKRLRWASATRKFLNCTYCRAVLCDSHARNEAMAVVNLGQLEKAVDLFDQLWELQAEALKSVKLLDGTVHPGHKDIKDKEWWALALKKAQRARAALPPQHKKKNGMVGRGGAGSCSGCEREEMLCSIKFRHRGKGGDVVRHQIQTPPPGPHNDAESEAQRPPKRPKIQEAAAADNDQNGKESQSSQHSQWSGAGGSAKPMKLNTKALKAQVEDALQPLRVEKVSEELHHQGVVASAADGAALDNMVAKGSEAAAGGAALQHDVLEGLQAGGAAQPQQLWQALSAGPPAVSIDDWLQQISLQAYVPTIKEYGYDSMYALDVASEENIKEMMEDPAVAMKKPHRVLIIKAWNIRAAALKDPGGHA